MGGREENEEGGRKTGEEIRRGMERGGMDEGRDGRGKRGSDKR